MKLPECRSYDAATPTPAGARRWISWSAVSTAALRLWARVASSAPVWTLRSKARSEALEAEHAGTTSEHVRRVRKLVVPRVMATALVAPLLAAFSLLWVLLLNLLIAPHQLCSSLRGSYPLHRTK